MADSRPLTNPQHRDHSSFSPYEAFFSENAVIDALCAWRVKQAAKRGDELFFRRIRPDPKAENRDDRERMFPPRRLWHRYRPRAHEGRSTAELNRIALKRAVRAQWHHQPEPAWLGELKSFVEAIRRRGLHATAAPFSPPRIVPVPKKRGCPEHRAIAVFETLEDRLVDGLVARYLRWYFEPVFDPASYAFRAGRTGQSPPTHHDAACAILDYRAQNAAKTLCVAECDIQGFFDCADQTLVRESLLKLAREGAGHASRGSFDPRAIGQIDAYLACYTFPRNVLEAAAPALATAHPGACFKWAERELARFHSVPRNARIGIPQGGAVSAVLGNCLLHSADREMRRLGNGRDFLYLRYCDDMIILSPSRRACRQAFGAYHGCMERLRLPVHLPAWPDRSIRAILRDVLRRSRRVDWKETGFSIGMRRWRKELGRPGLGGRYGKAFWRGKTRAPYRWAPPFLWFRRSPWIQFVGYQFRHDGTIRVRKDSFVRHLQKVNRTIGKLLRHIAGSDAGAVRKSHGQILHRIRMRLIAMAVGRRRMRAPAETPLPSCWCAGFKALLGQPFVEEQLKALDRHRERQLAWFRRALAMRHPGLPPRADKGSPNVLRYYGHPFSYHGQFQDRFLASGARSPQPCRNHDAEQNPGAAAHEPA